MNKPSYRSRVVLPDAPRLRQILGLLADEKDRELSLQLAGRPADAGTLAQRTGRAPRSIQGRLLRLARGGLLVSSQVNGRRVYRLAVGVSARQKAGRLIVRVATAGGSVVTIEAPYGSHARR